MISSKVFIGDGSTKVFPIDFEILGENYVQIWIDDIPINDKTKYDIINNSIVFNDDNIPAIDVKIIITVATTAQEIADLNAPPSGIDIVSDNIDNVNTVAIDIASVKTNSDNIDSIKTNATSIADINTVATDINSVKTNSDNIDSIKTNATNIDNINTNATNIANINTNASNIDSINTNATNIDSIKTVSDDLNLTDSNTKIVATNIDNVNIVGENITDVETFAKVYQNAHAEDIDVRTDGSALQVGDLYFNTTIKKMKAYDGTTWQLASSAVNGMLKKLTFTGDGTTTTFTITDGYDANYAEVYLNGTNVTADVDISDGQNIVFSTAPADGDEILGVFFGSFVLADCYTKAEADTTFVNVNDYEDSDVATKVQNVIGTLVKLGADEIVKQDGSWIINQISSFVLFDGADGTIILAHNISSVTRNDVGRYDIALENDMKDTNYAVFGSASKQSSEGAVRVAGYDYDTMSVSKFSVNVEIDNNSTDLDVDRVFICTIGGR